jgi:ParB/RepB/Spo0J family partition protein
MSQYVELDPSVILADENIRYGLKKSKVEELKNKFLAANGINTPIEVEALDEPDDEGHLYRLTAGHYRLTAAIEAIKEGATFSIPATVHNNDTAAERLKRQLSENMDRENLSPMDTAMAIKKLMDAGVPTMDIRKIFSRPGGAKGNKVQPASNSFINMMLSFLEFPKPIQNKIHLGKGEGGIDVSTAYELSRYGKDKWEEILAKAEAERAKELERDAKDEEKFLEKERKAQLELEKQTALEKDFATAKELAEKAAAAVKAKSEESVAAFNALKQATEAEAKAAADAEFKAKEAEAKELEKAAAKAAKLMQSLENKVSSAKDTAAERAAKLKKLREEAAKAKVAKASPDSTDIKKAAKEVGATDTSVPLKLADIRMYVDDLCKPSSYPKVAEIGKVLKASFGGEITFNKMVNLLAVLTGEKAEKAPKAAKKAE